MDIPTIDASVPRRLHPAAILLMALRIARELFIPAILPLALSLYRQGSDAFSLRTMLLIFAGIALFLIASITFGFVAWRRFTYRVEAGELRIEQGIFTRKHRYIPLERIQAIDLSQGVLQRLLGLNSVRIETAGGGGSQPEVSLPGVGGADSEWLRRIVATSRRDDATAELTADEPPATPATVRRLSVSDLLLAAVTAGRVGVAFAIVASGLALFDDLLPLDRIVGASEELTWSGITMLLLIGFGIVWLLGVGGTVLAHAGFTLTRDGDHLYSERGLLERRRSSIPINRIQAIRVVERLAHQALGLVEIRVVTAAYGKNAGESTVLFPLLRKRDLQPLLRDMAPSFAIEPALHALPKRARTRYATQLIQVGPVAVIAAAVAYFAYPLGVAALALIPAVVLLGLWQYRDTGWAMVGGTLVVRTRSLSRTTAIIPRRSIQMAETSQNPLQRRADLAHMQMRIASGSDGVAIGLIHMDADECNRVADWASPHQPSKPQHPMRAADS